MPRLSAAALIAATLAALAGPGGAHAENTVCQTINGRTVCAQGQGSLACQSVNGRMSCLEGPGMLTCETINGSTTCRRGPPAGGPDLTLPDPAIPEPVMPDFAMPDLSMPHPDLPAPDGRVSVERHGSSLRVRAGGVDVDIGGD